jgi:hypothetical protein
MLRLFDITGFQLGKTVFLELKLNEMKCILFVLILTKFNISLSAGEVFSKINVTNAQVLIALDRNHYFSGETLHGSISISGVDATSKVLRCEILEVASGKEMNSFYIRLDECGKAAFYVPILFEYKSGVYSFEFSACEDIAKFQAKDVNLSQTTTSKNIRSDKQILNIGGGHFNILNIDSGLDNDLKLIKPVKDVLNGDNDAEEIIKIIKNDESSLDFKILKSTNEQIHLVAVLDKYHRAGGRNIKIVSHNWTQEEVNAWEEKIFLQIKVEGINKERKFNLLGLYNHSFYKTFFSTSSQDGNAIFLLDDYDGSHNYQLLWHFSEAKDISLLAEKYETIIPEYEDKPDFGIVEKYYEDARKRMKIHSVYGVSTFKIESKKLKTSDNVPEHQKFFLTKEYKKFVDFKSFCKENSIPLTFINDENTVSAVLMPPSIYSKSYNAKWQNPLFMIDGKVSRNYGLISGMKMEDIDQLKIYYDIKEIKPWVGVFGSQGVIEISTNKSSNYFSNFGEGKSIAQSGFQQPILCNQEICQMYGDMDLPVFLPTVLWESVQQKAAMNEFDFHVRKSSVSSSFDIICIVKDADENFKIVTREVVL